MKKLDLVALFAIIITICISCDNEKLNKENFIGIKDISFDNYPKVDGSTSLNVIRSQSTPENLRVCIMRVHAFPDLDAFVFR